MSPVITHGAGVGVLDAALQCVYFGGFEDVFAQPGQHGKCLSAN